MGTTCLRDRGLLSVSDLLFASVFNCYALMSYCSSVYVCVCAVTSCSVYCVCFASLIKKNSICPDILGVPV